MTTTPTLTPPAPTGLAAWTPEQLRQGITDLLSLVASGRWVAPEAFGMLDDLNRELGAR